ncbi:flagellar hook-length control protein FliK [Marinobacter litoralis]|uniref:flagellar hook-length control protein FliK n=1 Tax=Marinobacter litoralis TaxID=187981 RepID=UPI0018EA3E07|nr:flagellar hook-length control protein FliK [Marinobacter litoralis]MBJ6137414.1 flagellar hook-length control protein FliK [Marinobacter litoralis]
MQQTILSQLPSAGTKQDPVGPKAASNSRRKEKEGSSFEQVSRVEQERLEKRRLEQKRSDRKEASNAVQDETRAQGTRAQDRSSGSKPETETGKPVSEKEQINSLTADEPQNTLRPGEFQNPTDAPAPLTFANLQTLMPAGSTGAVPEGTVNVALLSGAMLGKPVGSGGLNGQGASTAGLTSSNQFSDLLAANVTTDTARPVDPAGLLSSPRFQGTLDSAAQQALQGKLAGDANLPLRGYSTTVDVPVGQAEWGDKVMGKLSWLTAKNLQVAEIHLTPPDMGPMEVKVRVQNDQAAVTVHAANPVVREQLELHSNRLRDMLAEQGVSLSEFDVSDQPGGQADAQGDSSGEGDNSGHRGGGVIAGELDQQESVSGHLDLAWKGEVDIFA